MAGTARPHSDLDLVVVAKQRLSKESLFGLQDAFEESSLPFRVDLLDWHRLSPEFQRHIETCHEVLLPSANRSESAAGVKRGAG